MVENTENLTFASLLAEGIRRIKKSKVAISKELRGALGPDPMPWVRYERIASPSTEANIVPQGTSSAVHPENLSF